MLLFHSFIGILAVQVQISGGIKIQGNVSQIDELEEVKGYLVQGGESVTLICQEDLSIPQWTSDASGFNLTKGEQVDSNCRNESQECPQITIQSASNLDVGFYSCLNGSREVESVYLYVNEFTRMKTRSKMYFHWSGLEYSRIVLPCRPSNPEINTTLIGPPGVLSPQRDVRFDVRRGFFIENANSSTDSGLYVCQYTHHKEDPVKTLNQIQILHVPSPSKGHMIPLKPSLEVTYEEGKPFLVPGDVLRIRRGERLRVFCNVTLEHEGQILKIRWKKNGSFLTGTNQDKEKDSLGKNYIYSYLELSESPLGLYTCSVINRIGMANNRTFNVTYASKDPHCRLSLPEQKNNSSRKDCFRIRVNCGKNANISLLLEDKHHLNDPPIYWISPSGEEFSSRYTKDPRGNYKWYGPRSSASNNVILEIQSASLKENHGKYEFYCGGIKREGVLSVCVEVLCSPVAALIDYRSPNSYFRLHREAEFNCHLEGNPPGDKITWENCVRGNCTYVEADNLIRENDYIQHSKYVIEDISGEDMEISCNGCYKDNCGESKKIKINVVDYDPPLVSAFGPCTQFDDQDERCLKILDDEKRHSILYKFSMDNLTIVCAVKDRSRAMNMTFDKEFHTNYSMQFLWIRDLLGTEDNGTLLNCDNRFLTLRIIQSQAPTPSESNNMTNQTLEVNRGTNIVMDCSMNGNPSPVITWFKDGQTLNDSEVVGFLSHNESNLFLHAHETSDGGMFRCYAENLAGSYEGSVIIQFNGVLKSLGSNRLTLGLLVIVIVSFFIFILFAVFFIICCCRYQIVKDELTKAEIELFLRGNLHSYDYLGTKTEDLIELLPYDENIEFPRHRIKISHQIGSGAFGRVMLARAIGIVPDEPASLVAVKMCKPPVSKSQLTSLMSEIKIMLHLGKHLNVVNLLGAYTKDLSKRELWVIVEYCRFGNLQQYLHKHRKAFIYSESKVSSDGYESAIFHDRNESNLVYATLLGNVEEEPTVEEENEGELVIRETTFTSIPASTKSNDAYFEGVHNNTGMTSLDTSNYTDFSTGLENGYRGTRGEEIYESRENDPLKLRDLLSWAYQVARGMEHLMSKSVIHGDLAARNVLLSDNNVVKICDFGLARNTYTKSIYQKSGNGGLLPVKWMAIESLTHGIFSSRSDVWSYGILLWEIFSLGRCPYPGEEPDEGFRRRLESGYRMKCPKLAPPEIKRVMMDCWKGEAELRPDFCELAEKIGEKIHSDEKEHYLTLNNIYVNENQEREMKYAELIRNASDKGTHEETESAASGSVDPMDRTSFRNPEYFDGSERIRMTTSFKENDS